MQIYIKLDGKDTKAVRVNPANTVRQVKDWIRNKTNIPCEYQRLVFAGQVLAEDHHTLKDYNVKEDSALYLMYRLSGGF